MFNIYDTLNNIAFFLSTKFLYKKMISLLNTIIIIIIVYKYTRKTFETKNPIFSILIATYIQFITIIIISKFYNNIIKNEKIHTFIEIIKYVVLLACIIYNFLEYYDKDYKIMEQKSIKKIQKITDLFFFIGFFMTMFIFPILNIIYYAHYYNFINISNIAKIILCYLLDRK